MPLDAIHIFTGCLDLALADACWNCVSGWAFGFAAFIQAFEHHRFEYITIAEIETCVFQTTSGVAKTTRILKGRLGRMSTIETETESLQKNNIFVGRQKELADRFPRSDKANGAGTWDHYSQLDNLCKSWTAILLSTSTSIIRYNRIRLPTMRMVDRFGHRSKSRSPSLWGVLDVGRRMAI
ncbi:hypothetical protein Tco_1285070 [Tanacetum coccineum]